MSNMVVQTNVLALNSHRNMKTVGTLQEKASQKLSSGYRVNSAADDAAGLAISEKMRGQIRGLNMASKNAQDGISLIQTAEGGMQEIDNMVQRIRELIVYAANDTQDQAANESMSTSGTAKDAENFVQGDRAKIQDEINALMQEIDSMADRVEFNKKKVISGDYAEIKTAATTAGTTTKSASTTEIADMKADGKITSSYVTELISKLELKDGNTAINDTATVTTTAPVAGTAQVAAEWTFTFAATSAAAVGGVQAGDEYNFVFNGENVKFTASGSDAAAVIGDLMDAFKLKGDLNKAFDIADNQDGTFTITQKLTATDVWSQTKNADEAAKVQFGTQLTNTANAASDATGIGSSLSTAGTNGGAVAKTTLTVTVGTNSAVFEFDGTNLTKVGETATITDADTVLEDGAGNKWTLKADQLTEIAEATNTSRVAFTGTDITTTVAADKDELVKVGVLTETKAADAVKGDSIYFQVGANAGQGWSLNIGKISCQGLGIAEKDDLHTQGIPTPGKALDGSLINVVDLTGRVSSKNGESKPGDLTDLLNDMDKALTEVTTQRAKLGAAQNRLEYTIKSLDVTSENLSASESRIRDTDMAKEMMNLTKANVLQQSTISMLAQANQAPQSILQLLR